MRGGSLGLRRFPLPTPGYVRYAAGAGTALCLYERGETKTEHTLAEFTVENLESAMRELRGKGVAFEDYDFAGFKTVGGVLANGNLKTAWFKNPDGNILCLDEVH